MASSRSSTALVSSSVGSHSANASTTSANHLGATLSNLLTSHSAASCAAVRAEIFSFSELISSVLSISAIFAACSASSVSFAARASLRPSRSDRNAPRCSVRYPSRRSPRFSRRLSSVISLHSMSFSFCAHVGADSNILVIPAPVMPGRSQKSMPSITAQCITSTGSFPSGVSIFSVV